MADDTRLAIEKAFSDLRAITLRGGDTEADVANYEAAKNALIAAVRTENTPLLALATWIAAEFRLADAPKIRHSSQAETIHAEIVRRLGEARS